MLGVPLFSQRGYELARRGPPWRERFSPAEEARQEAAEREMEEWLDEHGWLEEIAPDEDPS